MRFIKITISFTSLIPYLILPRELRETTERTPTQLPVPKKCVLLIFPPLHSPLYTLHFSLNCRRLAPSSKLALCASTLYTLHHKNHPKSDFYLHISQIFCTFATESYAGGKYVLRKAFRKGSFFG